MLMFKTIKKIFLPDPPHASTRQNNDQKPTRGNPNFLTDLYRINKLLLNLVEHPQLCTVTFEDKKQSFSTSILEINPETKTIILDEMHPAQGNDLLKQQTKGKLSTHLDGIHLAFILEQPSEFNYQGIKAYRIKYPKRIYYPQRRNSPRVRIKSLHIPFAGICHRNQASAGGVVYDLSRTGAGLTLTNNHARIQRGDRIKNCHIHIDDHRLHFDLNIGFAKKDRHGKTNIGGFFENLSNRDQNKLSTFVAQLERKHIRTNKTDEIF